MVEVGAPPWALALRGLVVGDLLGGPSIARLGLSGEPPEESEETGREAWQSSDGVIRVITHHGRIGLISFGDTAALAEEELIGASRDTVARLLGAARSLDPVSVLFRDGPWDLEIGFDAADRVGWVTLSHADLL